MHQPLAETVFWVAALACAVAEAAILRSLIVQRRGKHSSLVPSASPVSELIWGTVPAIALVFLLFFTWRRIQMRDHHMQMDHSAHQTTAINADGPN